MTVGLPSSPSGIASSALLPRTRAESGSRFSRSWAVIPTLLTGSSIPRSCGRISTRPTQKGDSKSGARALARRPEHEDQSGDRALRPADPPAPSAGRAARYQNGPPTPRRAERRPCSGRPRFDAQWLIDLIREIDAKPDTPARTCHRRSPECVPFRNPAVYSSSSSTDARLSRVWRAGRTDLIRPLVRLQQMRSPFARK
jgi:hypothetical protein